MTARNGTCRELGHADLGGGVCGWCGEAVEPAPTPITPRRGLRFEHARFRQARPGVRVEDSPHEVCKVTQVRRGTVYYRTDDGRGGSWKVPVAVFPESVGRVLPDFDPPTAEQLAERARLDVEDLS